ncbi:hypothetical protein BGZ83_003942 [Gryganskiella cystojenkinii]|nr:hypothetical protein BGZ83_003942 [Gryganskiella cystojenkinii]
MLSSSACKNIFGLCAMIVLCSTMITTVSAKPLAAARSTTSSTRAVAAGPMVPGRDAIGAVQKTTYSTSIDMKSPSSFPSASGFGSHVMRPMMKRCGHDNCGDDECCGDDSCDDDSCDDDDCDDHCRWGHGHENCGGDCCDGY